LPAPEMADGRSEPQPGDLIEIDGTLHQHWALYVGHGYVIHLTPLGKGTADRKHPGDFLGCSGSPVPEFIRRVKKELLVDVTVNNKWRVNNESDQRHTPLPVEKILSCAAAYIGREVTYHSFGSNCEHFVKKLRYGEGVSEQVRGA
ncbi:PA216 protein, partial [Copsychus sechellarum]|nr:PA216 protein [Copsychus sechellarum]